MPFRLYNSLTKQVEDVRPADPRKITFYTCGPTVYDFAHIGNFRSFLMADVLRRWLESPLCELVNDKDIPGWTEERARKGREVVHVMNITDVGHMTEDDNLDGAGVDRMEEGGTRVLEMKKAGKLPPGAPADLDPSDPYQIAEFYAAAFLEDARLLGLKVAIEAEKKPELMPRPTQKISQMQALIRELLSKNLAYVVGAPGAPGTAVYFDVQQFPEYGRLSGNTLERLRTGAGGRVSSANTAGKRSAADFMLWKVDPAHRMKWDFPGVGAGYPGWHIECSAMARQVFGDTLDLHSGGEDNIFPHHECEIAQSCSATGAKGADGRPVFSRHWLHVRHLMVEGEKMSKSKGNFYTIRDLIEKGFEPAAIRLELIKTHYRSNANFTEQGLIDSQKRVRRWRRFAAALTRWVRDAGLDFHTPPPTLNDAPFASVVENDRWAWRGLPMEHDLSIAEVIAGMDDLSRWEDDSVRERFDEAFRKRGLAVPDWDVEADKILPEVSASVSICEGWIRARSVDRDGQNAADLAVMHLWDRFLGVIFTPSWKPPAAAAGADAEVDSLLAARLAARRAKNFAESDRIRDQLLAMGIEIKDGPTGTTWSRKARL